MQVDARALGGGRVCSRLCTHQMGLFDAAIAAGPVTVACAQESQRFADRAQELGAPTPRFVDIRDRAGWSQEGAKAAPKMAALLAAGRIAAPDASAITFHSEGVCLVYGDGQIALEAAESLSARLSVTLMLRDPDGAAPRRMNDFPIMTGRIVRAAGRLGAFDVRADGVAAMTPGGRGAMRFDAPRDGGDSRCDIILDLSGDGPLFPAHDKRDGYLRADPRDPAAVARALLAAADLVGEFEKPFYINLDAAACAHSRAGRKGCSRCIDVCPTSAISPSGDSVKIDPGVCAGCGGCAAVCPGTAAVYAAPPVDVTLSRMRAMQQAYAAAGGLRPRLLLHDDGHGAALIGAAARFGRGLPADVLPLGVASVGGVGHDVLTAAIAMGYAQAWILLDPAKAEDAAALTGQLALAQALTAPAGDGDKRLVLLETNDPDHLEEALYAPAPAAPATRGLLPLGSKRSITRMAVKALAADSAEPLPLPHGAPYGAVSLNADACTLCLACVSLCPVGALQDNPDRPQLRFQEDACLQCGICADACPENALTLTPRFDMTDAALSAKTLKEEEPFCCIECGKPFGVKSVIHRIIEKLSGKHWMFTGSDNARLIQMCDDCRVIAQTRNENSPLRMGARPIPRTTDDYN